jgi:hypothetical protein
MSLEMSARSSRTRKRNGGNRQARVLDVTLTRFV